jgi:hypothetical protein
MINWHDPINEALEEIQHKKESSNKFWEDSGRLPPWHMELRNLEARLLIARELRGIKGLLESLVLALSDLQTR